MEGSAFEYEDRGRRKGKMPVDCSRSGLECSLDLLLSLSVGPARMAVWNR